ncbi:MAG: hypothetical protein OTJ45_08130 [Alphaproteobacteria bacterium]|nr:hypothetical protein [Alphaproteobacteria bacterium]
MPTEALVEDWFDRTVVFIAAARAGESFLSFLARCGTNVVGSLAVQQFSGLCPDVIRTDHRRYSYVWGALFVRSIGAKASHRRSSSAP